MKSENGKTIRRISILAALVLLICMALGVSVMADTTVVVGNSCYTHGDIIEDGSITEEDAIYLLYHSVFGKEEYPITNFEKEGEIIGLDAIALYVQAEENPDGETVHAYKSDPTWNWDASKAVFKCACGEMTVEKDATITTETKPATCVAPGTMTYHATANLTDTAVYVTEKTVQTDEATNIHDYDTDVLCLDRTCEVCGHVDAAAEHDYQTVGTVAATCTESESITKKCTGCGDTYQEVVGVPAGHTFGAAVKTHVEKCEYKDVYKCSECNATTDGEHYFVHSESAKITKEATCSVEGTKRYTCNECGAYHDEKVETVADAHTWDKGKEEGTLIVYSCKENSEHTRTAINFAAQAVAQVSSEALVETKEIDINGASMTLDDETASKLSGDVKIEAEKTSVEELTLDPGVQLDEKVQAQIGENPVYNFSITNGDGTKVGAEEDSIAITISIPYKLQPEDDPDCIDIWFIDDDGTVNVERGTYANGAVTFTATHFSYYTVTRLTPEERCKEYGHNDAIRTVAVTCTEDGYELHVCARCNKSWKEDEVKATGHTFVYETTDATCAKAGKTVVTCEKCDYKKTTTIPAKGHTWETTDETATCAEAKKVTVGCETCDATKEIIFAQLKHDTKTTSVPATCETRGYNLIECKNKDCDYKVTEYTDSATGHTYVTTWAWNEDDVTAKAVFDCENCDNTFEKAATVTITKESPVTCTEDGYVDYLAKVIYNAKVYSNGKKVVVTKATGHKITEEWQYNTEQHFHECSICKDKLEAADHGMSEFVVTKEANCTDAGEQVSSCDTCKYQVKEVIPAEGHELDNGVCIKCGFGEEICKHDKFHTVELELAIEDGFCGGIVSYDSCECGKVRIFNGYDLACHGYWNETTAKDENGYVKYDSTYDCDNCELHIHEILTWDIDEEACIGTQYTDFTISNDSEEIFTIYSPYWSDIRHPEAIHSEEQDLSKYGMCPGTVKLSECPCGQNGMVLFDDTCDWQWIDDECGPGIDTQICTECGTKKVSLYNFEELENCKGRYTEKIILMDDETTHATYEYSYVEDLHDLEYSFDIADGATCMDGYTVHETCKNCDFEHSYYQESNHRVFVQYVDLSQYNLCGDNEAIVRCCPCGQECRVQFDYWAHRWVESNGSRTETANGYIISAVKTCQDCGLKDTFRNEVAATGNECEYAYNYTGTYSVNGKVLFNEKYTYTESEHDWEVVDTELKGNTCEDGVDIIFECRNCHETDTDLVYYHSEYTKNVHDASKYGLCSGIIEEYGCACNKYNQIIEDTPCDWDFVGWYDGTQVQNMYQTNTERYHCLRCDTYKDVTRTEGTPIGCAVPGTVTYEYIKGVTVELTLTENYFDERHDIVFSFDIADGATCSDGFRVYKNCTNCDLSESWTSSAAPGDHARYPVKTYDMAELGFCNGRIDKIECPCGEVYGLRWENEGCNWGFPQYDQQTGASVQTCVNCSGVRKMTESMTSLDGCDAERLATYTYIKDGVEKLSINTKEKFSQHDYEIAFDIEDGASCSDGYTIYRTCRKCGDETVTPEKPPVGMHPTYTTSSVDMKEYGFCGGVVSQGRCACGESQVINMNVMDNCDFVWLEQSPSGNGIQECRDCGSRVYRTYIDGPIDDCHYYDGTTYEFYTADGEFVTESTYRQVYSDHVDIKTEFEGSCESPNGYKVTMTCQKCGEVTMDSGYGHEKYYISKIDLSKEGFCGGSLEVLNCACGQNEEIREYTGCMFNPPVYDEAKGEYTYTCNFCSAKKVESKTETVTGENCLVTRSSHVKFINPTGKTVAEFDRVNSAPEHHTTYGFELLGDSCEDGYYVIRTCKGCGMVERDEFLHRNHQEWTVEDVALSEKGLCGERAYHYKCACGESDYWGFNGPGCNWGMQDEYGNSTCYNCNATKNTVRTTSTVDGKPCYTNEVVTTTYKGNNGVVWTTVSNYTYTNHDIVYNLSLKTPGTTCDQGYIAEGTCTICNETVREESWGHDRFLVEKVDLSDDGLCVDSTVRVERCACGMYEEILDGAWDEGCFWNYEGATTFAYNWSYDKATNFAYSWDFETATAEAYRCYTCNGVKYHATASNAEDGSCYGPVSSIRVYYNNDGEQLYEVANGHMGYKHNYVFTGEVQMNDPNDCEAGYYETYACTGCGNSYQRYNGWHVAEVKESVDFSGYNVCPGTSLETSECKCGKFNDTKPRFPGCNFEYSYNSYIDKETGIQHNVNVSSCMNCDIVMKTESYTEIDVDNCTAVYTTVYTYMAGDDLLLEPVVVQSEGEYHNYQETAELLDNATSCEQGVKITNKCKNCDESYEETYYHHYTITLERWDLKDYGSQCGGFIVKQGCACGANEYINDWSECDGYDQQVNYEKQFNGQTTIEGSSGDYYKTEYCNTCPAQNADGDLCEFTIYTTYYYEYDEENCELVRMRSYKLGSNLDGTACKAEIILEEDRITYHDYEVSSSMDGNTSIESSVCKNCQSSFECTYEHTEDGQLYSEREVVINNANDGAPQYRELLRTFANYVYDANNSSALYETKVYQKFIDAQGVETWNCKEYGYDWDNFDCTRECLAYDNTGYYEVYTEPCHLGGWYNYVSTATCTQPGMYERYVYCHVCEQDVLEDSYEVGPNGHSWSQLWGSDVYTCDTCGLESYTNGSGSIIFEDLTEKHGNDTNYVIGYYNWNNVRFEKKLFVVVGDHDMYLPTVEFAELTKDVDGINAIAFNKAAAEAAAEATLVENGYAANTDYALRFVFVPEMNDGDFDYAITLTDESLQN